MNDVYLPYLTFNLNINNIHTFINIKEHPLKMRIFLSAANVAKYSSLGDNAIHRGVVLFLANSYKSVSTLDSNLTALGNLYSFLEPDQYSTMPASSVDITMSCEVQYSIRVTGLKCTSDMVFKGFDSP